MHTGVNIAKVLKVAIHKWELERAHQSIVVVNEVAAREAGLAPHIKCLAHTLALASLQCHHDSCARDKAKHARVCII